MSAKAKDRMIRRYVKNQRQHRVRELKEQTAALMREADEIWAAYKDRPQCESCYEWAVNPAGHYYFGTPVYGWTHVILGAPHWEYEDMLCHHSCHPGPVFAGVVAMA
jgi:hypothetical protein